MRIPCWLLAASVLIGACGETDPKEPLEILTGAPPMKRVNLELGETNVRVTQYYRWELQISSRSEQTVRLKARVEGATPTSARVQLEDNRPVLREGRADMTLVFWPPKRVGPYEETVTLFCDELPEWSYAYKFSGDVVDRAPEGGRLEIRPPGLDLGNFKPGEVRDFLLTLSSVGSEMVTIKSWKTEGGRVLLRDAQDGARIVPGAELQINGQVKAPSKPGDFRESVSLVSDARIDPKRRIWLAGRVIPPYSVLPDRMRVGAAHAASEPTYRVRIEAEEGSEPFVVDRVDGIAPYLEIVSRGGDEPAASQELVLRLRKDAPQGAVKLTAIFHLGPVARTVPWRIELRVVGAIQANPEELNFGRVKSIEPKKLEVALLAFRNHRFEVKEVRSRNGYFLGQARRTPQGWRIDVRPVPGLRLHTPYRDEIVIETDDPDTPVLIVKAYVEMVP